MIEMTINKMTGSQSIISNDYPAHQKQIKERTIETFIENNIELLNKPVSHEKYNSVQKETVQEVVDKANHFLEPVRRNLKFELHDKLEKYYVTVIDSSTSEVIKEIPPKKFLDMYA